MEVVDESDAPDEPPALQPPPVLRSNSERARMFLFKSDHDESDARNEKLKRIRSSTMIFSLAHGAVGRRFASRATFFNVINVALNALVGSAIFGSVGLSPPTEECNDGTAGGATAPNYDPIALAAGGVSVINAVLVAVARQLDLDAKADRHRTAGKRYGKLLTRFDQFSGILNAPVVDESPPAVTGGSSKNKFTAEWNDWFRDYTELSEQAPELNDDDYNKWRNIVLGSGPSTVAMPHQSTDRLPRSWRSHYDADYGAFYYVPQPWQSFSACIHWLCCRTRHIARWEVPRARVAPVGTPQRTFLPSDAGARLTLTLGKRPLADDAAGVGVADVQVLRVSVAGHARRPAVPLNTYRINPATGELTLVAAGVGSLHALWEKANVAARRAAAAGCCKGTPSEAARFLEEGAESVAAMVAGGEVWEVHGDIMNVDSDVVAIKSDATAYTINNPQQASKLGSSSRRTQVTPS